MCILSHASGIQIIGVEVNSLFFSELVRRKKYINEWTGDSTKSEIEHQHTTHISPCPSSSSR